MAEQHREFTIHVYVRYKNVGGWSEKVMKASMWWNVIKLACGENCIKCVCGENDNK